ncbi:MAG: ATP-binding protein [Paracoccaceae bacterium]|nr:ATP-binding protein [Paracoccaceae bacterium]
MTVQVVMLVILVWNSNSNARHSYEHRLFDTAQNLAAQVAATSARYLFELDTARLGEYVRQTMSHDELLFVAVYDADGVLAAGQGPVPVEGATAETIDPHDVTDGVLVVAENVQNNGESLGRAVLGFSLEMMEQSLADARRQSLVLAAVLVFLTILISYVIGRTLTRDLSAVSSAVATYGAGKDTLKHLDASTTEVQTVVDALGQMTREREEAEKQRDETASFYRSLIERSSDVVLVLGADGEIRFVGPSVIDILGYDPEVITGNALVDLAADDQTKDLIHAKLQGTLISDVLELGLATNDGATRKLEVVWQARDGEDGEFVLNGRDVTERRLLEERMRSTERLEAIGQLTGGIAHDFNNQLAVIMGNLELFEEESNEAQKKAAIAAAISACMRSADLTKNLLSFSRKSHLAPQIVDLNALVRDASSWMQRTLPATIRVETSLLAGLWPARLDPSALENALLNLVINARDAMPAGGTLIIETSNMRIDRSYLQSRMEDLPEGQYVLLAVSDTGGGIAKENLDKVFQPFFTTKPVGAGSGLGLPSVHGFVRQSGGTIRVYSEVGAGTTFKLYFPAQTLADPDHPPAPEAEAKRVSKGARLLVVEDTSDVLDLLRRTLDGAGYDVVTARNGDLGYELFAADPEFDLLVTDIVMPGEILGTRLAKDLRALKPDLPVVFITGYATEAAMYGNGLRPDDIRLMKPVRRADLLEAVERAIAGIRRCDETS